MTDVTEIAGVCCTLQSCYPLQHVEGITAATNVMIEKMEAEGALIRKEMSGIKGLEYAAEIRTGRPRGLTITLWRKFADGAVDGMTASHSKASCSASRA
ncbi:MAG: hypothetical protein H6822_00405 [Planctomycetaceae bacterium]|nr:hypothetical protein [Planctomycetales bacterium]MCB9920607.1 hypothetical protein [Planctomycetaceae bacterium]